MAQQRTVSVGVKLLAQDYFAGLAKMQAETKKTATTAEQAFNKQKASFETLGRGALVASGVFTAAFVAMVKASADFEARMSQVQAVSKATSSQMQQLSGAAFTAGKAFGLSATQVADAQIELAKAGVGVKDIIGGALPGALALAAAGQLDVSKATEIASNAMTQFKLAGADVPHVADLLAASADKSVASVESVGEALNQSGLVAAQFGLSVEDTVGTLTAFSKAGLNGSDAGTSFKTMLLSLASPSKKAQETLDQYNITAYDAQGNFVGITALADNLRKGLSKASQEQRNLALSTIFGTDAIRAASVLYEAGGKKLQGYIDANNEAGFATLQASAKLDNLNGDVQKLGASFQNDLIKSGSAGNDVLRGLTQGATGLLDVFGDLPKPIQGSALAIAAVGAAVSASAAGFLLLTPKVAAAKVAMADLNLTAKGTALTFAKGAGLAVGVTAVVSGFAALGQQSEITAQQLSLAAKSGQVGFTNLDRLFTATQLPDKILGVGQAAAALKGSFSGNFFENGAGGARFIDGFTFGLTHLSDVYKSNEGQFKAIGEQLGSLARTDYSETTRSFNGLVEKLGGGTDVAKQALQAFPAYRTELTNLLKQSGQAATEQNLLAAATGRGGVADAIFYAQEAARGGSQELNTLSGSAADAGVDINKLADIIKGFGSVSLDARGAARDFEAAVDAAADAAKKNGRNLDISTDAGRANQSALDGIASAAFKASSAILQQSGSQEDAAAAIRRGRKSFIDAAVQMGLTRSAAKKLADQLGLIPSNVKTAVAVTGVEPAKGQIAALKALLQDINGFRATVYVNAKTAGATNAAQVAKNAVQNLRGFAGGGQMPNIGPKGKDSFLIAAGAGEHMFSAKRVDKAGGPAAMYAIGAAIDAGTLRGYADGGAIGDSKSDAAKASAAAARYARQLAAEKKNLAAQQKQVDAAQKRYDDIDGTKANRAAKKAAKATVDAQKKDVDAAEKRIDAVQKKLDDAKSKRDDATSAAAALRQDREDFVSQQRRGVTDPLSYVDQLRSMSRDDNFSTKRRDGFKDAANEFEAGLVKLGKQADDASKTLDDLKSSADSMRSSITSAIAGGYQLPGVGSIESTGSTVVRDGISYQTTTSGVSADAIDAYYQKGAGTASGFASDLQALAARGLDGRLLAELAGYGVEQGAPIAKALLSATTGQISSINANYSSIQGSAATAAGTVTDVNYKALIDAAQTVADGVAKQIADDSAKLRQLIASAFGLTGYAVGTMNAARGLHLVGEQGPELVNFGGGEQVATAARTRALMAAARSTSMSINGPSSVTIVDVDGTLIGSFRTAARTVARQEIAADAHTDSVLLYGGAA